MGVSQSSDPLEHAVNAEQLLFEELALLCLDNAATRMFYTPHVLRSLLGKAELSCPCSAVVGKCVPPEPGTFSRASSCHQGCG